MKSFHKSGQKEIDEFNGSVQATKAMKKGSDVYKCEQCHKVLTSLGSIQNHIRREHTMTRTDEALDPALISILESQEPEKKKYRVCTTEIQPIAIIEDLPETKPISNQKILCPHIDCLSEMDAVFVSSRLNLEWLSKKQEETGTTLVTQTARDEGSRNTSYMICKHEGTYVRSGTKKYGHDTKKQTGDALCTAYLRVVKIGEKVSCQGCFYHFGHDISVANLSLTSNQKEKVVNYVKQGLHNKAIVKLVKKETDEHSRLHFLSSDDIRNLKNQFDLNEEQLDKDDLRSVEKRVAMKNLDDGIRYYSAPDHEGNNFVLVIITPKHLESITKFSHKVVVLDDTFNVTMYNLKLTTLTVIDNSDRSEPAGFLLSSSTTSKEVSILFNCLKDLFPEFRPSFFMTDEASCFWNGYSAVFDNSGTRKVICRWHVYRSWKKKATQLLKGDLLSETMQSLNEVLREPRQEKVMHRLLSMLTRLDLAKEKGADEFSAYFRTYYYVDQRSEDTYIVTKISDMKEYTVRDYKECICDIKENTHCDYCGACGYRFDCDCLFSRAGVACKHIHGVLKFAASQQANCELLDDHANLSPRPSTSSRYPSANLNSFVLDLTRKEKDEHDDRITKRMDRLSTMWSAVYADLRKQTKDGGECFEKLLEKTENALLSIMPETSETGLVVRSDAGSSYKTAREIMHVSSALKV
ncbi:hypothetical protein GCK72_006847 [Caenorhabditis remanei]|uniref:C2H2-type domain-containing protein n=1 Tax=Caenorhabditis remanei TaxID=31234 RepID=A0A6A5HHN8_CAERE|nr:hypothetical protein GCK72_006847 [Caenorhabditis remanei]KAF1766889.1 hypothetical protein GCK72_006847 [Caenorhabditis remanei]